MSEQDDMQIRKMIIFAAILALVVISSILQRPTNMEHAATSETTAEETTDELASSEVSEETDALEIADSDEMETEVEELAELVVEEGEEEVTEVYEEEIIVIGQQDLEEAEDILQESEQLQAKIEDEKSQTDVLIETMNKIEAELAKVEQDNAMDDSADNIENISVSTKCPIESSGVSFLCDVDWKTNGSQSLHQAATLAEEPKVVLEIKKVEDNIKFLGQLTKSYFEKSSTYNNGFKIEPNYIAGKKAILVKGVSKVDENIQLRDYFYLHNGELFQASFQLSPKEKWDEAKIIVNSYQSMFE